MHLSTMPWFLLPAFTGKSEPLAPDIVVKGVRYVSLKVRPYDVDKSEPENLERWDVRYMTLHHKIAPRIASDQGDGDG